MSTLWTPGGEIPVDRNRATTSPEPPQAAPTSAGPEAAEPGDEERRAQVARMQQLMLEAPAGDIVAEHAMGLYELAVLHLSQSEPRLAEARTAIDAFAALVEGMEGRLGEAEEALAQVLPQLRMAFVQATDRAKGEGTPT